MITSSPIQHVNADCFEHLTRFLNLNEKVKLRSSSRHYRLSIPDICEEAKTFLVFELNLPLIQKIISRTRNHDEAFISSTDSKSLTASEKQTLMNLRQLPRSLHLYGVVLFLPAAFPLLLLVLLNRLDRKTNVDTVRSEITERIQLAVITTLCLLIIAIPIAFKTVSELTKRQIRTIHKNELKILWQRYLHQPAPQDIIAAGHALRDRLTAHITLDNRNTAEGGMDQAFATPGLDSLLEQIRSSRHTVLC